MSTRAFRVKGTTSDVTSCELCGRDDLRGTVALEILDADGNGTGEVVHYGSDCGARAAGWTQADMRKRTTAADKATRDAEAAAREEQDRAEWAAYCGWLRARYGVNQPAELTKVGERPLAVLRIYRAETEAAA